MMSQEKTPGKDPPWGVTGIWGKESTQVVLLFLTYKESDQIGFSGLLDLRGLSQAFLRSMLYFVPLVAQKSVLLSLKIIFLNSWRILMTNICLYGRKVCRKISQIQLKCWYNEHWFVDLQKHGVKRMHCLSLKRATFYLIQIHAPHFVYLRLLGTSD